MTHHPYGLRPNEPPIPRASRPAVAPLPPTGIKPSLGRVSPQKVFFYDGLPKTLDTHTLLTHILGRFDVVFFFEGDIMFIVKIKFSEGRGCRDFQSFHC